MSDGSSSEDYSSDDDYSDEVSEEEDDSYTETETLTEDLTDSMITESESEPSKCLIIIQYICDVKGMYVGIHSWTDFDETLGHGYFGLGKNKKLIHFSIRLQLQHFC